MWIVVTRATRPIGRVAYRKLGRDEDCLRRAHMRRLSLEDRRARFLGSVPRTRRGALVLPEPDVMIGAFVRGVLRGVAELYRGRHDARGGVEIAISVERRFQNRGIGTALAERMLIVAANRGIGQATLLCAATNVRMHRIAAKLGARTRDDEDNAPAEVLVPTASPATLMLERLDDTAFLVTDLLSLLGQPWWPSPARSGARP